MSKVNPIIERWKRERAEQDDRRRREQQALLDNKARWHREGRDGFDKDIEGERIELETMTRLINTSDTSDLFRSAFPTINPAQRLASILGNHIQEAPAGVLVTDYALGYVERAKERWEGEFKALMEG